MRQHLLFALFFSFGFVNAQGQWTQKTNFGGMPREGAAAFTIGTKGYVGTGILDTSQTLPPTLFQDMWEYDASANTWTQKANFPAAARAFTVSFAIGNKGYVGTGYDGNVSIYADFWEFDPAANNWVQKANFPGVPRGAASCFTIGTSGYVVSGRDLNNFYPETW